MTTPILSCTCEHLEASLLQAVEVLLQGGLVAFPTETVYGLGACALDATAVERIFEAKGRPPTNPIIVHVADVSQISRVASAWPESAARLAEAFWPGPLTLVLPKKPDVPDVVTAGGPTVAIRIPSHPIALRLLQMVGQPIAAPSANRSNRLSPTRAEHVLHDLDGRIDLILDGGKAAGGIESTVVDVTCFPPQLLRPGLIESAAIERLIGPIARPFLTPRSDATALRSPGMLPRHYAPRTPMECVADDGLARVNELHAEGVKVALVTWRGRPAGLASVRILYMPTDPAGYAAMLYGVLHLLDTEGLDRLIVPLPPDEDAWLAVRDRLRRASA